MECEKWCAEVSGMVHGWTHTHSHIRAHLESSLSFSLNCVEEAKVWRKVELHDLRSWTLLSPPQTYLDYDVSETQTSILFNYFCLNPPHFKYIYHHLHNLLPRILPSSAKQPFSQPLLQWHDSSLLPLISVHALFCLYDSQGREHKMEFLIWSGVCLVQNKTGPSSPFSQMVYLYWWSL